MRIKVNAKDKGHRVRLSLWVPNGLVSMPAVSRLILKETSGKLTPQQLRALVKAIKETRKRFGPMNIVDVETADGDIVKISI